MDLCRDVILDGSLGPSTTKELGDRTINIGAPGLQQLPLGERGR